MREIAWASYGQTVLNPIAFLSTLLMGILVLYLKRELIIIPILVIVIYIPTAQRIVIAGLDFTMLKILILFWVLRMIIRKERPAVRKNEIDVAFYLYLVLGAIAYVALRKSGSAIVNRFGYLFDAIGIYMLGRFAVRKLDDLYLLFKVLIILSVPMALAMVYEQLTRRNLFSVFGGVPAITVMREGRLRSQGAFAHAILAGSFGGAMMSLVWGVFSYSKNKALFIIGTISSLLITITAASSGAIMSFGASLIGIFLWKMREQMHLVRRGLVAMIIIQDIMISGPVYAIIWRMTVVGGSTGFHRFMLIDQAVKRVKEWALFGVQSTAHWGWGLQDITNHYILVGVNGGLLSLIFFIVIFVYCFKAVGNIRIKLKEDSHGKLVWALACSLLSHMVAFLGVSYFGNMTFFFNLTICLISTLRTQYIPEYSLKEPLLKRLNEKLFR